MDVNTARTLLAIVETGSFKAAAERLHVTQSTVSARVRGLETLLGRKLLQRSKAGVVMTPAGEQFHRHAVAMVRIWRHAQLEVGLADEHRDHLAVGAQISLWEGLLLRWVAKLRRDMPDVAVSAEFGGSNQLIEQLTEGTLDLAVVYRGNQRPGFVLEHIFDEELVMVTSGDPDARGPDDSYVFVNWGPEFSADHAITYPDASHSGLNLNLGAIGLDYLLETRAAAYFPMRLARPYIASGQLGLVSRARRFVYPVYAGYPEERDDDSFGPILEALRKMAEEL